MSFRVYFGLATGLAGPIKCPKGTLGDMLEHMAHVEKALGLTTTQYRDNPPHWDHFKWRKSIETIDDGVLCREVGNHNDHVRWFYDRLREWSETPVEGGEVLTPEDAAKFWRSLEILRVPPERWTGDYYRARMEAMYAAMRGEDYGTEGMTFDAKKLTPEQADAVIALFADYLDTHDIRLAVPVGHDRLASSDAGEYDWCSKCGAVAADEICHRIKTCRKRGGCPLRDDRGDQFDD